MQKFQRKADAKHTILPYRLKKNSHFLIFVAALLIIVMIACVTLPLNANFINSEKNATFTNEWQRSIDGGPFQSVKLPSSELQPVASHITLKNKLPHQNIKGATVLVRTSQQNAEVFVDGVSIYNSLEVNGNAPSSAYHFVRMPTEASDREITVVLSSPYQRYAGMLNQIYIGSKASNVFSILAEGGMKFALGFIMFIVGFLLTLSFLFSSRQIKTVNFAYLGAFFICAGFWMAAESTLLQFIIPYPVAVTNLSIFGFTMMPVFAGLYYYDIILPKFHKTLKYILIFISGASLATGVIAIFNASLPLVLLPFYTVLSGAFIVFLFACTLIGSLQEKKFSSPALWGLVVLCVFGLLELIFYLGNLKKFANSNFLSVGLLLFCIMMLVDFIRNVKKAYQDSIAVNTLTRLAYTDSLTGIKNRTAFLERLSEIDLDSGIYASLGMFDVNNLKLVNDTMGHISGDALLLHCVQIISHSVREEDELYRIGGDEFVVVLLHDQPLDPELLRQRLHLALKEEQEKYPGYPFSIASGYATFSKKTDHDLFATLKRADDQMYSCKKKQKDAMQNQPS